MSSGLTLNEEQKLRFDLSLLAGLGPASQPGRKMSDLYTSNMFET